MSLPNVPVLVECVQANGESLDYIRDRWRVRQDCWVAVGGTEFYTLAELEVKYHRVRPIGWGFEGDHA